MKVLVTGGAGYIGSHVIRELRVNGHEAIVLDDLSNGHEKVVKGFPFFKGDVGDEQVLSTIFQTLKIEAVIHLAGLIEVGESVIDPAKYYQSNVAKTINLLSSMNRHGIKKFIFSSTAAVYGNPSEVPIKESHALKPINPYGRSKMMIEGILEDLAAAYGMGFITLRYFNVAGADPSGEIGEAHKIETHLIPRILSKAGEFSIFGSDYPTKDGTCIRDYIHVSDLARAHVLALESTRPGVGEVYNVGSEEGFSVFDVFKACEDVTGRLISYKTSPRRPGDPAVLIADSSRIRRHLRWLPLYSDLKTIISHAWNWHSRPT